MSRAGLLLAEQLTRMCCPSLTTHVLGVDLSQSSDCSDVIETSARSETHTSDECCVVQQPRRNVMIRCNPTVRVQSTLCLVPNAYFRSSAQLVYVPPMPYAWMGNVCFQILKDTVSPVLSPVARQINSATSITISIQSQHSTQYVLKIHANVPLCHLFVRMITTLTAVDL